MKDGLRVDGLDRLCSDIFVQAAAGKAEGGAIDIGAGVEARAGAEELKLPKPLAKS